MKYFIRRRITRGIFKVLLIAIIFCSGLALCRKAYSRVYSPKKKTTANIQATANIQNKKIESRYITAVEKPKYKVKRVYELQKLKKLSEHSIINYGSGIDRNTNLAIACKIINSDYKGGEGYLLNPGEIFDWYEVIGNTTEKKGYKKAGVILNHKHAEALGGGVCQVASTLNSAAVKANLKTKCEKHSLTSSYIRAGIDYEATVAYNSEKKKAKNLVIKNTKKYPVLFVLIAKGKQVNVKCYKMKKELKEIQFIPES